MPEDTTLHVQAYIPVTVGIYIHIYVHTSNRGSTKTPQASNPIFAYKKTNSITSYQAQVK